MRPRVRAGRGAGHSRSPRATAAGDPSVRQAPPRALPREPRPKVPPSGPLPDSVRWSLRCCCSPQLLHRPALFSAPFRYRSLFVLSDEPPDHLGGIVDHRNDPGVVESGWADDPDRADDLLPAVMIRCNHDRAAGDPEEMALGANKYLH